MANYVRNRRQARCKQRMLRRLPSVESESTHPRSILFSQHKIARLPKKTPWRPVIAAAKIPSHPFNESCATKDDVERDPQACLAWGHEVEADDNPPQSQYRDHEGLPNQGAVQLAMTVGAGHVPPISPKRDQNVPAESGSPLARNLPLMSSDGKVHKGRDRLDVRLLARFVDEPLRRVWVDLTCCRYCDRPTIQATSC